MRCWCTLAVVVLTAVLNVGCAYPTSTVEQGTLPGQIFFQYAPVNSRVILDGRDVGIATVYDGNSAVLSVTPGPHHVEIVLGGQTIYDQEIYVGSNVRMPIEVQ